MDISFIEDEDGIPYVMILGREDYKWAMREGRLNFPLWSQKEDYFEDGRVIYVVEKYSHLPGALHRVKLTGDAFNIGFGNLVQFVRMESFLEKH